MVRATMIATALLLSAPNFAVAGGPFGGGGGGPAPSHFGGGPSLPRGPDHDLRRPPSPGRAAQPLKPLRHADPARNLAQAPRPPLPPAPPSPGQVLDSLPKP